MLSPKNLLPYMGVQNDFFMSWPNLGYFRIITYQAYNAMGLIGSECNGIAVLSEDNHNVVLDEHYKELSGYFGVSNKQKNEFERICAMSENVFKSFVNSHPRARYTI